MAVNDKINKADYNTIRTKVINVLGTGSADFGYGQPVRSSAVSESNKVTVNEWANLYYDIVNCYVHQTGSAPTSPSSAVEGATVRYDAAQPNYQYDTFANTIVTNRFNIAGSQSFTTSKGATSTTWPGTYGSYWNTTISCTVSAFFADANSARYFFNSGGEIRFSSSLTGSTANSQTIAWTSLLSSAGTKSFGGNKPGTSTEPNDGTNFYRLSNSYQTWTTSTASSPYTSNLWRIQAKANVADNSAGGATQIDFLIQWVDGYTDPVPGSGRPASDFPPGDEVYGTVSLSVTTLEPTGVLVPAASGNFSVSSPSFTIGTIAP